MRHFCTLFDAHYLSRGLAMYESLATHCKDFRLYIFTFDDRSNEILKAMSLPHVVLIPLSEFEDDRLLSIKGSRTKGEYCWTCTPSTIAYCLNKFDIPECTYLDADLYFFADPNTLIEEMGNESVLITEHRYGPGYDKAKRKGIYCVQFITFRRDEKGMAALNWWKDKCIEWCFDRDEDGKFGDQKYLDDWTQRFKGVHVLRHLGGGVAPWNSMQYTFSGDRSKVLLRAEGQTRDVIFFHFHHVKFYRDGKVDLGNYPLSKEVLDLIYVPYLKKLQEIEKQVAQKFDFSVSPGRYFYKNEILTLAHKAARKVLGVYNIFDLDRMQNGLSY